MGVETLASYGLGENPPTTATLDEMAQEGHAFHEFLGAARLFADARDRHYRPLRIQNRYRPASRWRWRIVAGYTPSLPEWASPAPGTGWAVDGRRHGLWYGRHGRRSTAKPAAPRPELPKSTRCRWRSERTKSSVTPRPPSASGIWPIRATAGSIIRINVGFDHYSGLITGTTTATYFSWNEVVNGEVTGETGYTPADKTDDAIAWIDGQGDEPWFHVVRIQPAAYADTSAARRELAIRSLGPGSRQRFRPTMAMPTSTR